MFRWAGAWLFKRAIETPEHVHTYPFGFALAMVGIYSGGRRSVVQITWLCWRRLLRVDRQPAEWLVQVPVVDRFEDLAAAALTNELLGSLYLSFEHPASG